MHDAPEMRTRSSRRLASDGLHHRNAGPPQSKAHAPRFSDRSRPMTHPEVREPTERQPRCGMHLGVGPSCGIYIDRTCMHACSAPPPAASASASAAAAAAAVWSPTALYPFYRGSVNSAHQIIHRTPLLRQRRRR